MTPSSDMELESQDVLLVVGQAADIQRMTDEQALTSVSLTQQDRQRWRQYLGAATVLIHPESEMIGKSLRDDAFRTSYGLHVLGVRRNRKPLSNYEDAKLEVADSLLVAGPWVANRAPRFPTP